MRARRIVLGTLSALLLVLGSAPGAQAYEISETFVRWPFDEITYYPGTGNRGAAVEQGMRSWDRANTGFRFRRVGSASADQADIVIEVALTSRRDRPCLGRTFSGYAFGQSRIFLAGRCNNRRLIKFGTAHEVGHVLGLLDQDDTCSIMNRAFLRRAGTVRPGGCAFSRRQRSPVRADDVRGARRIHARRVRFWPDLCDPPDEEPIAAPDTLCRYSYDCRGQAGENVIDRDNDGSSDFDLMRAELERCNRQLTVVDVPPGGVDANPR